ncbi:MAG: retroviral-like aspartic protease family protein, partial [Candidatus Thiodiazotropha sp.]
MLGQQAVPEKEGHNSVNLNEKLNHESMLNNVSSLVNLRNAKKLARNGASQGETTQGTPIMSPGVINQSVPYGSRANEASEFATCQPQTTEPRTKENSSESHRASQKLSYGSEQRDADPIQIKSKPVNLVAKEIQNADSCPMAEQSASNPLQTPLIKRIVRSDGFYLEAKVNGEKIVFTIDTGATKTIISERVYKSIPSSNRPKLNKTTGLTEASGQPLAQLGTAEFIIVLNGMQFKADIIVANIEDDGLFGHDLLSMGDAHLLYDEHALMFMGVHIPCIKVGSTPRIRRITTADHVVVPAFCEKIIDVFVSRLTGDDQQETPVILEPNSEFHERYGLLMASSLSDMNSRV